MRSPPRTRASQSTRIAAIVSIVIHAILAVIAAFYIAKHVIPERADTDLAVEWVRLVDVKPRVKFPRKQVRQAPKDPFRLDVVTAKPTAASPNMIPEVVRRTTRLVDQSVEVRARETQEFLPKVTTQMEIEPNAPSRVAALTATPSGADTGRGVETGRVRAAGIARGRQGLSLVDATGTEELTVSMPKFTDTITLLPEDKLGAVLVGRGRDISGHIRIVRLKHRLSDWWQDPTAMSSLIDWLTENTHIYADMKFAGGSLELSDDRILNAPLVIMTGHDRNVTVSRKLVRGGPLVDEMTDEELANLRRYLIDRKGLLFFDDCGFNGIFAEEVRRLLKKALPEYDLVNIPHDHEIYTIYYELSGPPQGGDVFWGSENNPKISPFRYHKGIFIGDRLAVLYNRKDYMCAMETAEIPSRTMLRLRRSPDVYRFMTNLLVYALKYGGNVDRSEYAER